MKNHITKDKVGQLVQTMFDKGLQVSVYDTFLTVRADKGKTIYVDICEKQTMDELIQSIIDEAYASVETKSE